MGDTVGSIKTKSTRSSYFARLFSYSSPSTWKLVPRLSETIAHSVTYYSVMDNAQYEFDGKMSQEI